MEDQKESETNENRPPSQPATSRMNKRSKERKTAIKPKHNGGEPDRSDQATLTLWTQLIARPTTIETLTWNTTNTMESFSIDYKTNRIISLGELGRFAETICGCKSASTTRNLRHNDRRYISKKREQLPALHQDPTSNLLRPAKIVFPDV
jgi:hypothetical protein